MGQGLPITSPCASSSTVVASGAVSAAMSLEEWLRAQCLQYVYDLRGVFRVRSHHDWPLVATGEQQLEEQLAAGGHLLPLPKEPAALANVLEVSIVDFILNKLSAEVNAEGTRGTERGYPDLEISGAAFGGGFHAVDIKIAQRKVGPKGVSSNTQSRITLYTGNTYFRYPRLHWPSTFRPFEEYVTHLDVIGVYTLNSESASRVEDLELIVQEPWRIASHQRSSTTREYIGAVQNIDKLRAGQGEFDTPEDFYRYWRKFSFKVGVVVQQQLDKLLNQPHGPGGAAPVPPPELPL
jgi:Restriction endonuclease EcoRV